MALPLIGYQNFADAGTLYTPSFSGGSWRSALPLTNLQDELLSKVARSSTAAAADTQFEVDLGVERSLLVIGVLGHNLSLDGTVRIRSSNSAGSFGTPIYDSGTVDVYTEIYPTATLQTGHPAAADRLLTLEDWTDPANRLPYWLVLSSVQSARYWLFEFTDTSNADGYVDIGRLWMSWAYQPTISFASADLGWVSATSRVESEGGADLFDTRARRREFRFTWSKIDSDEALTYFYDELNRKQGMSKQLAFVYDPDDVEHLTRRSMLCTIRELSPLAVPLANWHDTAFGLREVL